MKFNRVITPCLLVILSAVHVLGAKDDSHKVRKRAVRIISKPPIDNAEFYKGWNLLNHADNALKGGTIGLEVETKRFVGPVGSIWRRLRDFVSRRKKEEDFWSGRGRSMDDLDGSNVIDPRTKPYQTDFEEQNGK